MPDNPEKRTLEDLEARLDQARGDPLDPTRAAASDQAKKGSALSLAFRVGVELISAVAVGTAIGWGLDEWFGTRPWLMLVFIILGGAAGILNVYRMASGFGYGVGYTKTDREADTGDDRGNRKGE